MQNNNKVKEVSSLWQEKDKVLFRTFLFPDFSSALAFVNQIGVIADKNNHHPSVELSWGKVVVRLFTHETGDVTEKDRGLAKMIDSITP